MLRLRLMFNHHDAWIALSGDRPSRLLITSARASSRGDGFAELQGAFRV